jgi:hypothetical protein
MACANCPDAVTFTLRNKVRATLDSVRSIKSLTDAFSRALREIAGLAFLDIEALLNAIPDIPVIDFTDILAYLTCPLTPLAIAVDDISEFEDVNPNAQLSTFKSLAKAEIDEARRAYEDTIRTSDFRQVINIARNYANELVRARFNEAAFAEGLLIAATVLGVCGEDEYQEGPYQDFANEVQGFSLTGGIPSDLDPNAAAIVQRLVQSEEKFRLAAAALV